MHACADQASEDFGLFWIFVGLGNFCTVNLFGELSDVLGRKVREVAGTDGGGVMTQIHIGVKMIVREANRIVFSNQTLFGVVCQCQAPITLSNDPYRPLTHGNPLRTRRSPGTPVLNPQVSLAQFAIVVPSLGCLATYAIPCLWVSQTYAHTPQPWALLTLSSGCFNCIHS